ncbi:MAG TPA: pyridoxamine 5'-phosphate oxidase family protein [Actinomycetota bacterium]|nr:pyridoxamine 5'-phosphate oxidase family protein [Actinomycetota bacterium]
MRTNLTLRDIGGLLDEPLVAVLATLRLDGSVLLSPVWHEWRDGGFNLWLPADDVKTRHLQRDPRATLVVAESADPLRGVELRTEARLIQPDDLSDAIRIATRYVGPEKGAVYVEEAGYDSVIGRLEPGHLRIWDFADE